MKINEKTLIKYATTCGSGSGSGSGSVGGHSGHGADKEGWLFKRGEVNKSFQKRWCLLKGNLFYYWEKKGDKEPIGCLILEGCRIEVAENETELFAFKIAFAGQGTRSYVLGTDTQESLEAWMKALSCASYDYLKMVVAELQRQLDDINDTQRKRREQVVAAPGLAPALPRVNPFDRETTDLIDLGMPGSGPGSGAGQDGTGQAQTMCFTKRPFAEIHQYYGIIFRNYFDEQKRKHQTQRRHQPQPQVPEDQPLLDFS